MINNNSFGSYCNGSLDNSGNIFCFEQCDVCGKRAEDYTPSPHHLPPGTILRNRYKVGCVLGEGGYGITYIGYDCLLQMRVAVKEFFPIEFCTRNVTGGTSVIVLSGVPAKNYTHGMQKYLIEARLLARMDKQRVIVNVRDYFEENGTAYIVMEYIEGITFTKLVEKKGGRIPQAELFRIVEPLFGALCILHQYGLIHRDMCPDNLMLETSSNYSDCRPECPSMCLISNIGNDCDEITGECTTGRTAEKPTGGTGESLTDRRAENTADGTGECPAGEAEEKKRNLSGTEKKDDPAKNDAGGHNQKSGGIRGSVRLLDFGSARSSDSLKDTLTITLRHGYAPIEQYQPGGGQGPWTDIYALCATLYYCLTGIIPPIATNRIIEDSLKPPSELGVEMPAERESALMRGLRVQPHRRCRTVKDLWTALYRR